VQERAVESNVWHETFLKRSEFFSHKNTLFDMICDRIIGGRGAGQESSPEGTAGGGHDGAVLEQDVDTAPPALPRREVQRRRPGVVPHVHEAREPPAPPQLRTH
jgi:hypothetical protein